MPDVVSGVLLATANAKTWSVVTGACAALFLAAMLAFPMAVAAQDAALPVESEVRASLICTNARGHTDAHVHLVGGRGRPARYRAIPTLSCDGAGQTSAETTTIWWPGSIWHVVVNAESNGVSGVCEDEGMQLPALVRCATGAGEVLFSIEPEAVSADQPRATDLSPPRLTVP